MVQQQQQQHGQGDSSPKRGEHSDSVSMENGPVFQAAMNLQGPVIENRAVTSTLPHSPLRNSLNAAGNIFNFSHPLPEPTIDTQLLQRLQTLIGYTPPQYSYGYQNQSLPYLYNHPSLVSGSYAIQQHQPTQNLSSPLSTTHSYSGSPITERRFSPVRNTEQQLCQSQQNLNMLHVQNTQQQPQQQNYQQQPNYQHQQNQMNYQPQQNHQKYQSMQFQNQQDYEYLQNSKQNLQPPQNNSHYQVQQQQTNQYAQKNERAEPLFIKPLPQMGTLTTTDPDGNVRVIVPVPSNSAEEAGNVLASLRLTDEMPLNGPGITRSTSERVPNRSGLMSQVQRTTWARHTTK